jgi:hypothetical protein
MSKQMTLGTGFEKYSKTTRREKFLTEMDRIMPWGELCALIAPVYPKAGDGRPPKELEMMRKRSINPILLFGRWRPKRLGLDVERQQRLDLFEGLGLGQLGE